MSMFVLPPPPEDRLVRRLVDFATSHLPADLRTATLAAQVGVSQRHLNRLFANDLGQTPAQFVRHARTEAAAHLLATTTLPVSRVANQCGFGSPEHLRQAFTARYGIPPSRSRATQQRPVHG